VETVLRIASKFRTRYPRIRDSRSRSGMLHEIKDVMPSSLVENYQSFRGTSIYFFCLEDGGRKLLGNFQQRDIHESFIFPDQKPQRALDLLVTEEPDFLRSSGSGTGSTRPREYN
jgi:hypothetical protein